MERHGSGRATAAVSALFTAGLVTGAIVGDRAAARAADPYDDVELLAHVIDTIERDYVEPLPPGHLVEAAIEGMVASLDPHSRWLSAADYAAFDQGTQGTEHGIGVDLDGGGGGAISVRAVQSGSPAGRDGLRAGDTLVAVDGVSVADLDPSDVTHRLEGERGTPVTLTVVRDGATIEIHTVRDLVHVAAAHPAWLGDGVGYVRLVLFQRGSGFELARALDDLDRQGMTGLVLDLRDNPGGLLEEAVQVADLFLENGPIVTTRGRVDGETVHAATTGARSGLPIVVLVNGRSASAAEVVAGALQDTGRARILGTRTWGKGSVQTVYENENGSALKLTIGRYYTPSGAPVADGDGRAPDVVVDLAPLPPAQERLRSRLLGLDLPADEREALLELLDHPDDDRSEDPPVPWEVPPDRRLALDPPLALAVALLGSG